MSTSGSLRRTGTALVTLAHSKRVIPERRTTWLFGGVHFDLTGHRPNIYVEAGFALKHHEKNRLIFLFEPTGADDKVPFDFNTFKYVQASQAAEIPQKVGGEIAAIVPDAGAVSA